MKLHTPILIFSFILNIQACAQQSEKIIFESRDSFKVGDVIYDNENGYREYCESDTTLIITKNDTLYPIFISKTEIEEIEGFQEFINNNLKLPNVIKFIDNIDLTDDGIIDSCEAKILFSPLSIFIENSVYSNGVMIWYDSLTITDQQLINLFWFEDERSFSPLKPYSTHYIAKTMFSSFIGDKIKSKDYSGILIWNLAVVSNSTYIWDKHKQKFIPYFGP